MSISIYQYILITCRFYCQLAHTQCCQTYIFIRSASQQTDPPTCQYVNQPASQLHSLPERHGLPMKHIRFDIFLVRMSLWICDTSSDQINVGRTTTSLLNPLSARRQRSNPRHAASDQTLGTPPAIKPRNAFFIVWPTVARHLQRCLYTIKAARKLKCYAQLHRLQMIIKQN